MTVYEVKIYYDTICAWSYIGHRTLFQAISLFQKTYPDASSDDWTFTWLPFYRDRSLPIRGVPLQQRLESAFGRDRTEIELARVQRIGRQYGIAFDLSGAIGHTRDSHRIIQHAGVSAGPEEQKAVIEAIYFQWFERGGDITSHSFLQMCADRVGLDPVNIGQVLAGTQYANEVDRLDEEARERGVSCVPTFDINGTKLEGAQDASTFYEVFVALKEGKEPPI